jgi:nitrate/nitrite transporter NarK
LVGWRLSMVGFGLITLLGSGYFVFAYHGTREPPAARVEDPVKRSLWSTFRIPIVWVIPLLGLANAPGFAATFFVPAVVRSEFHGTAAQASTIIAASYALAIFVNPACGWLADRFDRWLVMACMSALMIPACVLMSSHQLYVFGIATAVLVSLGHAAANQVYPTAAGLLRGRETGPIMGIVGLGSGLFGYLGPQALGWLRDYSGGFTLGWHVIIVTTVGMVGLMLWLRHYVAARDAVLAAK